MLKKIITIIVFIIVMSLIIFGIIKYINRNKSHIKESIKIPILLYHDIVTVIPETDKYNFEYITTVDSFEENIKTLLSNGYSIITINDLCNNKELPSKPIIINFDDGLISNYDLVFPILKKYNIKVGMGITTDLVGAEDTIENRKYFSWEKAKEMHDSGVVEFYSHGKRHIFYTDISAVKFKKEIMESIDTINSKLNTECYAFAYPYGDCSNYMVKILENSNVKIQLYDLGINKSDDIDYSFMKRLNIPYGITGNDIISYIECER